MRQTVTKVYEADGRTTRPTECALVNCQTIYISRPRRLLYFEKLFENSEANLKIALDVETHKNLSTSQLTFKNSLRRAISVSKNSRLTAHHCFETTTFLSLVSENLHVCLFA